MVLSSKKADAKASEHRQTCTKPARLSMRSQKKMLSAAVLLDGLIKAELMQQDVMRQSSLEG